MNEPETRPAVPRWILGAVLTLLTLQVGLLWLHGAMLERQHADLAALREDVQDLSDSLDEFQGTFDDTGSGGLSPSRQRIRHRPSRLVRARMQEQDPEEAQKKQIEEQRKAEKEAVAKARDLREKVSFEENARKAEEKAKVEKAVTPWRNMVAAGVAVALFALLLRAWARRRG